MCDGAPVMASALRKGVLAPRPRSRGSAGRSTVGQMDGGATEKIAEIGSRRGGAQMKAAESNLAQGRSDKAMGLGTVRDGARMFVMEVGVRKQGSRGALVKAVEFRGASALKSRPKGSGAREKVVKSGLRRDVTPLCH
jgi:hypothetical protein